MSLSLCLYVFVSLFPTASLSLLLWSLCVGLSPVLSPLSWAQAIRLRMQPPYLMILGTVSCSFAFMLPVSTTPNSIAFATGHLLVKDMLSLGISQQRPWEVWTGLLMNLMGVLLLSLAMNT
uniref:Solute carrier family 13 member 5 n=1 Tax=Pongo abelii TaxID=9601 RepID=A0A8I5TAD1_PONAB